MPPTRFIEGLTVSRPLSPRAVLSAFVSAMLVIGSLGCHARPAAPGDKYFGGKPVDDWLVAIEKGDARERKRAADMLGNVGPIDMRSVPALIKAVTDTESRVRDAAVLGLSKMGPTAVDAVPALERALSDKDRNVRAHAAAALGRIQPDRASGGSGKD